MAKAYKVTIWSIDPGDDNYKELMASFEVGADGKVTADIQDDEIKDLAKKGLGRLTLKKDGEEFVKELAGSYVMSTFVSVGFEEL